MIAHRPPVLHLAPYDSLGSLLPSWSRGRRLVVYEGDLAARRFVAVYRTGRRVSGVLTIGVPPKAVRPWLRAIATGAAWGESVGVPAQ
ncbi:hypothetical protein U5640_01945 [Streptomyces sp. SS7]|uniref:hypothetical protein n=1 Tax=Streptomyces sp. SS7 TaxID=3108485 RepID=UPI0030ECE04E